MEKRKAPPRREITEIHLRVSRLDRFPRRTTREFARFAASKMNEITEKRTGGVLTLIRRVVKQSVGRCVAIVRHRALSRSARLTTALRFYCRPDKSAP